MRSRYTAFARHDIDYLVRTHEHPAPSALSNELAASIGRQRWLRLSVIETKQGGERDKTGFVSFIATYIDRGAICELRERSEFRRRKGRWRYLKACKESPHRVEN
jgi:SEC-C motif-containing protein